MYSGLGYHWPARGMHAPAESAGSKRQSKGWVAQKAQEGPWRSACSQCTSRHTHTAELVVQRAVSRLEEWGRGWAVSARPF